MRYSLGNYRQWKVIDANHVLWGPPVRLLDFNRISNVLVDGELNYVELMLNRSS